MGVKMLQSKHCIKRQQLWGEKCHAQSQCEDVWASGTFGEPSAFTYAKATVNKSLERTVGKNLRPILAYFFIFSHFLPLFNHIRF